MYIYIYILSIKYNNATQNKTNTRANWQIIM